MTRFAFSGLFLDRPQTGTGQYSREVLRGMFAQAPGDEWLILTAGEAARTEALAIVAASDHDHATVLSLGDEPGNLGKVWFEQVAVPQVARDWNADVLHVPYFGSPVLAAMPVVVTIHDVIMLVLPQHRGGLRVRGYTALARAGARRAARILADSECSRQDIVRLCRVPADRVETIYLGIDTTIYRRRDEDEQATVRRRYGLPATGPFVLYLGGFDDRKNVPLLLDAFAGAAIDAPLVLGGAVPAAGGLFPDVKGLVERLGLAERVLMPGFIAEADKPALYSAAQAFVYPSRYEGFGLPPLEAMACGTAVITTNAGSLAEVAGDVAITVPTDDAGHLRAALEEVMRDGIEREGRQQAGPGWASRFSWHDCAARTLAALRAAIP